MARRILSLFFGLLFAVVFSACEADRSPENFFNSRISEFGEGKIEEDYGIVGSGDLLDELIDKYSGSYYYPVGKPMTDDEYDDLKEDEGQSDGTSDGGSQTYEPGETARVSNYNDLLQVMHNAYDNTAQRVEFSLDGGFKFDAATDMQTVYTRLQREDPVDVSGVKSWSWWNNGDHYYITIQYWYEVGVLKSIKAETSKLVDSAVKKIGTKARSQYEIVNAVNNYLCDTVYYPEKEPYEPVTHTAYGALKNGCAVCEGYACAAKLILDRYGVECDIIVGDVYNAGGHAWNLVKLDGKWYQLDVTWNDQISGRKEYFLVTDSFMKKTRTWKESDYPASAKTRYAA